MLPEEFAGETGAENFAYYELRRSHGSSLSRAMHGLVAAGLEQSELALQFSPETSAIDLANTYVAIDGSPHVAALGDVWMIAVLGSAGPRLLPDGLALDPRLPIGWSSVTFPCRWHGRHLRVHIGGVEPSLTATLDSGAPITPVVQNRAHILLAGEPLHVLLNKPFAFAA